MLGTASLIATAPAVASAQITQLSVTNLASPAMPSEISQPPVVVASRGTCATPLAVPDICPPGSWPAVDGDWGPKVAVAGGDKLQLEFDAPVDGVLVGSTATLPPDLVDPDGHPVSNADAIPGISATPADAAGTLWTVQLPQILDARVTDALTLSVVASDPVPHDFALGLTSPRPSRYGLGCEGNTYYSFRPDYRAFPCATGVKGPPPGLGGEATPPPVATQPVAVPKLALSGSPRWTKRGLRLNVTLPAGTPAKVTVRAGKVLLGRTTLKAARSTERVVVVPVRASNRHRRARALRVTLAATGLQRVDAMLKLTSWPRLRIG